MWQEQIFSTVSDSMRHHCFCGAFSTGTNDVINIFKTDDTRIYKPHGTVEYHPGFMVRFGKWDVDLSAMFYDDDYSSPVFRVYIDLKYDRQMFYAEGISECLTKEEAIQWLSINRPKIMEWLLWYV